MSFRNVILRELRRRGWSGYRLAEAVHPHVSRRMIQAYLAGDADMTGERLARVCEALDLALRPVRRRRRKG